MSRWVGVRFTLSVYISEPPDDMAQAERFFLGVVGYCDPRTCKRNNTHGVTQSLERVAGRVTIQPAS